MSNNLEKNVHILPLGHEIERAVAPFANRHVDKVYLVVDEGKDETADESEMRQLQEKYTNSVKEALEEKKIEVVIEKTNMFDLGKLISTLSQIIKQEKIQGNSIHINISSSGRFASVAAAIAGMAHNITVYYVHSMSFSETKDDMLKYGVSRCNCEDPKVTVLQNYQLKLPEDEEGLILELLYIKKHETKYPWVSPKDVGALLNHYYPDRYPWNPVSNKKPKELGDKIDIYRKEQSKFLMKYHNGIIKDLLQENYVERKQNERKHVLYQITPSGEYALFLYGLSGKLVVNNGQIEYR